jgi:hypothetical protein
VKRERACEARGNGIQILRDALGPTIAL